MVFVQCCAYIRLIPYSRSDFIVVSCLLEHNAQYRSAMNATVVYVQCRLNVKVKVKLSLRLTKHHAMKTYRRNGGIVPHILDLGTRWR
jgi:hypothetical protein